MSNKGLSIVLLSVLVFSQPVYSASSRIFSISTSFITSKGQSPISGKHVGFFMVDTFDYEHSWGVFAKTDQTGKAVIDPEENSTDQIDTFCLILNNNYCLDGSALSMSGEQKLTAYGFWGKIKTPTYFCVATVTMSSSQSGLIEVKCKNTKGLRR